MTAFPPDVPSVPVLRFTDADLARAIFVTGRAPADVAVHGYASCYEFIHRAALVPAYVRSTNRSRLARSGVALDLDRSEKVNLSYSLGQALTAIFCEQVLSVKRLLHIDRYSKQKPYEVSFKGGGQRPDLFGVGANGWVVAEAKGRSNAMESGLQAKLTDQKRMVLSISGIAPWVSVGCVAAFPAPDRTMWLHAFDPEDPTDDAHAIEFDKDEFALAYYEPFLRALDLDQARRGESGGDTTESTLAGVSIGLMPAVEDRIRSAQNGPAGLDGLDQDLKEILEQPDETDGLRYPDGSLFRTSWHEEMTLKDF